MSPLSPIYVRKTGIFLANIFYGKCRSTTGALKGIRALGSFYPVSSENTKELSKIIF